jgi:hypothetical protein
MFCNNLKNKSVNDSGFQVPLGGFRGKISGNGNMDFWKGIISPREIPKA